MQTIEGNMIYSLSTAIGKQNEEYWFFGEHVLGYTFEAKVYAEPSESYGINCSKVSKLCVKDFDGNEVFNWDRGMDIDNLDDEVLNQIIADLEDAESELS